MGASTAQAQLRPTRTQDCVCDWRIDGDPRGPSMQLSDCNPETQSPSQYYLRWSVQYDGFSVQENSHSEMRPFPCAAASGKVHPRPGVIRLMDEARAAGLKLAVCSAATKSSVIFVIEQLLGVDRYRVGIVIDAGIGAAWAVVHSGHSFAESGLEEEWDARRILAARLLRPVRPAEDCRECK